MTLNQTTLYKQHLLNAIRNQAGVCFDIRNNIKRLQEKLTLELAILEDIHKEIDGLE